MLGAGLPKAAAMGPDPHRLADLQCRRANREPWLRAGSVVLGLLILLLAQSQPKVDPSERAVVVQLHYCCLQAANGAI